MEQRCIFRIDDVKFEMRYAEHHAYPKLRVDGESIYASSLREDHADYKGASYEWWRLAFRQWAEEEYE